MKDYYIYCIKDEFADRYFYKSDLLYRFIKTYQSSEGRTDFALQFKYITNVFPSDLITAIISQLKKSQSCQIVEEELNMLGIKSKGSYLRLSIYNEKMILNCKSLHAAETFIFPSLKAIYPSLFIIGPLVGEYGWISPNINKYPLTDKKEVLYSYL